jgi:hypothetical protein
MRAAAGVAALCGDARPTVVCRCIDDYSNNAQYIIMMTVAWVD